MFRKFNVFKKLIFSIDAKHPLSYFLANEGGLDAMGNYSIKVHTSTKTNKDLITML